MNYTPTTSQRKEKRINKTCQLHSVTSEDVKEESWESLVGNKIFFWSWSITKVQNVETARDKYFIFHTIADLGFYNVQNKLKKSYPDWSVSRWRPLKYGGNLAITVPYVISHAVEIHTHEPETWLSMIERITKCLEPNLI